LHEGIMSIMSKPLIRRLRARKGVVLPAVLFSLVIMGVFAVAALQNSTASLRGRRSFRQSGLALYAAEAGLRNVIGAWPDLAAKALLPGDSIDQGWQTLPNHAKYRAVITRVDAGGLQSWLIIVQGRGATTNLLGGQRTVVRVVGGMPMFNYGIWSRSTMTINGNSSTTTTSDSYDSSVGPYNPLTASSAGSIGANGAINTSGIIKGNLTSGSTINVGGGSVTGTMLPNATNLPSFQNISCPSGGYTPNSQIPGGSGISYNQGTGQLTVNAGANLILPNPPYQYYFSDVTLNGNSTLTVTGVLHTDIYVDGQWKSGGGNVVNLSGTPTKLGIWGCGTNTSSWAINGGSGTAFSVYAPNHAVDITGGSDFYGAIVGNGVTASGGSHFHYDVALQNSASAFFAVLQGSWTELTLY